MFRLSGADVFRHQGPAVAGEQVLVSQAVDAHCHDFLEMAWVTDGTGFHVTNQGVRVLVTGSFVVIRPGHWHGFEGCHGLSLFNVYIDSELFQRELLWILDYPDLARCMLRGGQSIDPVKPTTLARIEGWLSDLAALENRNDEGAGIVRLGLANCAVAEMADVAFESRPAQADAIRQIVRSAMDMMASDLVYPWTVDDLSRRLSISSSCLHRQFSSQIGVPPMAWLLSRRAERAAILLVQTDLPVAQVGSMVGWQDANYASRRFRMVHGVSPTVFRRQFHFQRDPS